MSSLFTYQDTDGTSEQITFTTGNTTNIGNHSETAYTTHQSVYVNTGFESNTSHFNVINGIQLWKVPDTGTYEIEVAAGGGGTANTGQAGGKGRIISGKVTLTQGDVLRIIVGSRGGRFGYTGGGGGASVFGLATSMSDATPTDSLPLIISGAGGGGGSSGGIGKDANTGVSASAGWSGVANSTLGTGGLNGQTTNGGWGGGGSGWTSDGGGNSNAATTGSHYQGHYNSIRLNSQDAPNGAYHPEISDSHNFLDSGSCKGASGGFGGGGNGGCNGSGGGAGYTGGHSAGAGGGSYFNTTIMTERVDVGTTNADTNGYVKIKYFSVTVPTTDISFSRIRGRYLNSNRTDANNHSSITNNSQVVLSDFRGATFTDNTKVSSSGPISVVDTFRGRTYGRPIIKYDTGSFKVYSDWSASPTVLQGTTASSTTYTGSDTANKTIQLSKPQPSGTPYSTILLTPNAENSSTSPGFVIDRSDDNAVDEVTLWFKVVSEASYSQVQWGLISKDMGLTGWTNQLLYMDDKHGTHRDALRFHAYGFHNYTGSRDDITSSSAIVIPQYKNDIYGVNLTQNFHNIIGKTAGTLKSSNVPDENFAVDSEHFFYQTNTQNYPTYRGSGINTNFGMKVKWYSTTIMANLVPNSNNITPVSSTWSTADLSNVFSGMYVSGTGIPDESGCFIGDIHTNYMKLYRERGVQSLTSLPATAAAGDNIKLTISGYLYWTLATTSTYSNPVILGPPHTVLPRYQADSSGSNVSTKITECGMFVGDTTSNTSNQFTYDIRNTDPGGTLFSYSVPYSFGSIYEFGLNIAGGTYAIAGSLSSIEPISSGYPWPLVNGVAQQDASGVNYSSMSAGSRFKFIVAGKVVALGVQNQYGGKMALFPDLDDTAATETVNVLGNGMFTGNTLARNYRYTTLVTPLSVAAGSVYRTGFKNTKGGYSYHNISPYDSTYTSSGNIEIISGGYIWISATATEPQRPTNLGTYWNYGSTDLIFVPDPPTAS
jgi:hypothetical protein